MIINKQFKKKKNKTNRTNNLKKMAETTEFIGGMEKIIAFSKSQSERVKKLEEENKKLKEQPALKRELSEAMKVNGSWMKHMKQDYEIQLRSQKDMVSMYSKKNKKLEEENKKLKEQHENYVMTHCCDMSCDECGSTTTEDDLQISLKHGSLICEACYSEKEEEYQPKGSRIDPEGLHDYMKEQNDKLKEEE